jgi:hypothetical protein
MKIGDRVSLKNDKRIGTIVGIVPHEVNPMAHYFKVKGIDFSKTYNKSGITSTARQIDSFLVAVDGGKHKDRTAKPEELLWPKAENITPYVKPEPIEVPSATDDKSKVRKGRK